MSVRFYKGRPLFVGGKVAMANDCCCDRDVVQPPSETVNCLVETLNPDGISSGAPTMGVNLQKPLSVDLTIGNSQSSVLPMCGEDALGFPNTCESLRATWSLSNVTVFCAWSRSFNFCCESLLQESGFTAKVVRDGAVYRWHVYVRLQNDIASAFPPVTCKIVSFTWGGVSAPLTFDGANGYYRSAGTHAITQRGLSNSGVAWCTPFDNLSLDVVPIPL